MNTYVLDMIKRAKQSAEAEGYRLEAVTLTGLQHGNLRATFDNMLDATESRLSSVHRELLAELADVEINVLEGTDNVWNPEIWAGRVTPM